MRLTMRINHYYRRRIWRIVALWNVNKY